MVSKLMSLQFALYSAQLLITPELLDLLLQELRHFRSQTARQSCRPESAPGYLRCLLPAPACRTSGIPSRRTGSSRTTRRVNGEPCLTDQLLQCLAFLEANVLDVLIPFTVSSSGPVPAKMNCTSGSSLQTLMSVPMPFSSEKPAEVENVILLRCLSTSPYR